MATPGSSLVFNTHADLRNVEIELEVLANMPPFPILLNFHGWEPH